MKTWLWAVPALAVACWLSDPVAAQKGAQKGQKKGQFQPGRFGGGGQLRLLENADVQKDLKLSGSQVEKVTELSKKNKDALKDLGFKEMSEKRKEIGEANKKAIDDLLTADQKTRLGQLELQQKGARAFTDKKVIEGLSLSEEQTEKVKGIVQESGKKMAGLFKEFKDDREGMRKKMAEVNKGILTDVVKTLTSDQKKKWEDMIGAPFSGTLPSAGFFGGGFGRPGGEGGFPNPRKKKTDN